MAATLVVVEMRRPIVGCGDRAEDEPENGNGRLSSRRPVTIGELTYHFIGLSSREVPALLIRLRRGTKRSCRNCAAGQENQNGPLSRRLLPAYGCHSYVSAKTLSIFVDISLRRFMSPPPISAAHQP